MVVIFKVYILFVYIGCKSICFGGVKFEVFIEIFVKVVFFVLFDI